MMSCGDIGAGTRVSRELSRVRCPRPLRVVWAALAILVGLAASAADSRADYWEMRSGRDDVSRMVRFLTDSRSDSIEVVDNMLQPGQELWHIDEAGSLSVHVRDFADVLHSWRPKDFAAWRDTFVVANSETDPLWDAWRDTLVYVRTEVDGVIGNEVTGASDSTLNRSGDGTGASPKTLKLNIGKANTWTATQTLDAAFVETPSSTQTHDHDALTGITDIAHGIIRVQGDSPGAQVTADPRVADGTDGQRLVIQGDNDTNTLVLADGQGLGLAGGVTVTLGKGDMLVLRYDAGDDLWYEQTRSDN